MSINYTEFWMYCDEVNGATHYEFIIEKTDSVFQPIPYGLKTFHANENKSWVTSLEFGNYYRWKVNVTDNKGNVRRDDNYKHFYIRTSKWCDTSKYRARVIKADEEGKRNWIVADYARVAYNQQGLPVWFLPDIDSVLSEGSLVRDIRFTKDNTVTFLVDRYGVECTREGDLLWKTPIEGTISGDSCEFLHHSFEKQVDGTYLTLGQKYVEKEIPLTLDLKAYENEWGCRMENGKVYKGFEFGTIILYDADKKIKWSWNSHDYIQMQDLFVYKTPSGVVGSNAHMNAVDMDIQKGIVSVGFRDLNRIVLIDMKSKEVLNSIGQKMPSGEAKSGDGLFSAQHDCSLLGDGQIAVFNNNIKNVARTSLNPSTVLLINIGADYKDPAKVDFEFNCLFDTLSNGSGMKGGNVQLTSKRQLLVCMGALNRIVLIDMDKNKLVDFFIEQKDNEQHTWKPFPQYRAYLVEN